MTWTKNEEGLKVYEGDLPVRGGSYGDPAAVPFEIWEALFSKVKNWTTYTHMWRTCDQRLKKYAMASVDSPEERAEAQALGWRTFMVVPEKSYSMAQAVDVWAETAGQVLCPATDPHPRRGKVCYSCKGRGWVPGVDLVQDIVWGAETKRDCPICHGTGRVPTTCAVCGLCRGTSANAPSIWEVAHGKNKENHKW